MSDFLFIDAGFNATSVAVRPVTEAGRSWFAEKMGAYAVGATLAKSGAYAMMAAVAAAGLTYTVEVA
ncbi:MAG: hypothetical protein EOS20_17290 [Mesorhizobium sp.]|uniref:hypothetical protein n=1 Tax=Mesorhizobium sp. TaxID=1871066 RepID=UPI000FE65549|nr:hypothetical protein [Mesorhizobium sp.]RWQ35828.1 MAG: hypothetical protein EOS20_17290 [Mesorhizobium sp.]